MRGQGGRERDREQAREDETMKKMRDGGKVDKENREQQGAAMGEEQPTAEKSAAEAKEAGVAGEAQAEDPQGEDETAEGSAAAETDKELEALRKELDEAKDRLLRLTAEFDNYRKRTLRERSDLISQASGKTLEALLPVVDDFDRAVASSKECDTLSAMQEGLELIHKSLYGFLKREGIEEIEAIGLELDTDVHDAVAKAPAPEAKLKGKIIDVVRKGYKLRGVVLRHAQVVVGE